MLDQFRHSWSSVKTIDSILLNIIWLRTLHTFQLSCLAYFEIHKHFKIDNKKATWFSEFARDLNKLWMNRLRRRIATNGKSKLITDNKLCIWLAQRCWASVAFWFLLTRQHCHTMSMTWMWQKSSDGKESRSRVAYSVSSLDILNIIILIFAISPHVHIVPCVTGNSHHSLSHSWRSVEWRWCAHCVHVSRDSMRMYSAEFHTTQHRCLVLAVRILF